MTDEARSNFHDVPKEHWAFDFINTAFDMGLIEGVHKNMFEHDRTVTRGEFVKMIVKLLKLPASACQPRTYADVNESTPYYEAIAAAKSAYLIDSIVFNDMFKPNIPITREEMASVAAKTITYMGIRFTMQHINISGILEDYNDISQKYLGAVETVYRLGIMSGTTAITFSPKQFATLAQAATVLIKLYYMIDRIQ